MSEIDLRRVEAAYILRDTAIQITIEKRIQVLNANTIYYAILLR